MISQILLPQSFDNSGFVDYEYEDLAYHSDLDIDSGYQEPQEVLANAAAAAAAAAQAAASAAASSGALSSRSTSTTLNRSSPLHRPHISSPTRIVRPNLAPINQYPQTQHQQQQPLQPGTLGKRAAALAATLNRNNQLNNQHINQQQHVAGGYDARINF